MTNLSIKNKKILIKILNVITDLPAIMVYLVIGASIIKLS